MSKTKSRLLGVGLLIVLSGCSTRKNEMLPPGDSTMLELWNNGAATTHTTHEGRTAVVFIGSR